ncbi:MAG: sugar phosphate isomerase/epimerase, partial [Clostridia bacterium]|nr:sugar phosphate isomerase/epimerase [Clostridia bacterium]
MSDFVFAAFADEAGAALSEQIDAMRENRVPFLEIRGVDGKNVTALTRAEAKEVARRLADAGLAVWSIGSPIGKIGIRDDFAPHLELFRRTLELADILEAKAFRLFSFYIPSGEDPEIYRDEVLERMERFAEAGKGSGLLLCHENEKGIYGDVADRVKVIHEALPDIGAVFDPANYVQTGEDTLRAWDLVGGYVKYMHIKDALPSGDVVPAGKGAGHLPELLAFYRKAGGRVLTLEPHLTVFKGLAGLEREGGRSGVGTYA